MQTSMLQDYFGANSQHLLVASISRYLWSGVTMFMHDINIKRSTHCGTDIIVDFQPRSVNAARSELVTCIVRRGR